MPVAPTKALTYRSYKRWDWGRRGEKTNRSQAVVDRGDHQRVAHPDGASRCESCEKERSRSSEDQANSMAQVHAPRFCDRLSFSAGRRRSLTPAATRHHFITGAQKNTVFGPAGPYDESTERNGDRCPSARRSGEGRAARSQTSESGSQQRGQALLTCGVVHERLELGARSGGCSARHVLRRGRGRREEEGERERKRANQRARPTNDFIGTPCSQPSHSRAEIDP
jgi:hypothetical protein